MKILISTSSFGEHDKSPVQLLESRGFEIVFNPYRRKLEQDEVVELAKDCGGIIAGIELLNEGVFKKLPRLKAISRCGTGLDNVDLGAAKRRGIAVRSTPESPTQAVAELTLALILSSIRRINSMDRQLHSGVWNREMGRLLSGKTVGIIGLGRIGRRVVTLLRPFGVKILANEPKPDKKWVRENKISLASLKKLLKESDVVTLHVPYTEETRNLINSERLKTMKKEAILINTSRGGLVDETALYGAIKSGSLGGAALDVMEAEPYRGPLTKLDNVILTPHIGSYALEARVQMEVEAAKNMIEMLGGK